MSAGASMSNLCRADLREADLDDVTLENSCMSVSPGSQRGEPLDHSQVWIVGGRKDICVPGTSFDWSREVPITTAAGSCSSQPPAPQIRPQSQSPPETLACHALHERPIPLDRPSPGEASVSALEGT